MVTKYEATLEWWQLLEPQTIERDSETSFIYGVNGWAEVVFMYGTGARHYAFIHYGTTSVYEESFDFDYLYTKALALV